MKIRIYLTESVKKIPFNYSHKLAGLFHNWLGENDLHDRISLYSLGWLKGKVSVKDQGLFFTRGAVWDIGIYNPEISEQLIQGLLLKNFEFYGMKIRKVDRLKPPSFKNGYHRFLAGSPILLRKTEADGSRTHVIYNNPESEDILKRVYRKKATEAGMNKVSDLKLSFDQEYSNPKTKLIDVKGIKNRASVCPLIAEGSADALEFLWTVGAGELTGVGFGSLDHTEKMR